MTRRRVTIAGTEALIASLRKAEKIVITRDNPPDRTLKDDEKISTHLDVGRGRGLAVDRRSAEAARHRDRADPARTKARQRRAAAAEGAGRSSRRGLRRT